MIRLNWKAVTVTVTATATATLTMTTKPIIITMIKVSMIFHADRIIMLMDIITMAPMLLDNRWNIVIRIQVPITQ